MLIKNFTMSSAIAAENFFGGTRERKKLDSWTSTESFCRSCGLFLSDSWNSVKRLKVDQRHVCIWTGPLRWLRRLRFTAGSAKVGVTVVWVRAGGTSVGRLPCAFDLYTQLNGSRYNEKRTDPIVRPTIMDKSLGTLLHFWGVFQFTQVQPLPSPHKQCWTRVSRIFSEFQLCRGWGRENCNKISKTLNCLKREPRNNRKIWILQYYHKDFCPTLSESLFFF